MVFKSTKRSRQTQEQTLRLFTKVSLNECRRKICSGPLVLFDNDDLNRLLLQNQTPMILLAGSDGVILLRTHFPIGRGAVTGPL